MLAKLFVALVPVIITEGYLRIALKKKVEMELGPVGTLNIDAKESVRLIFKMERRIAAAYTSSVGVMVTGVSAISRDPRVVVLGRLDSVTYGLLGIVVGIVFFVCSACFAKYIKPINFRTQKERGNRYLRSFLTGPIRLAFYGYYAIWLFAT